MTWSIIDATLIDDEGRRISFQGAIAQCVKCGSALVVRLRLSDPSNPAHGRVYGVRDGAIAWVAGPAPGCDGTYTGIWMAMGRLFAYDYAGVRVELDCGDGRILESVFVK